MSTSLAKLLDPQSIAVVGASPRGNRGLTILQNLARFGSRARIYPVHPRERIVGGLTAYPNLYEVPEVCDFVAIALNADRSLDVVETAVDRGVRAALLIAGGFGEGGAGLARRDRLSRLVETSGLLLCGPNCYGILNVNSGFAAYSGDIVEPFTSGRVALVMQSGALTHSLTDSSIGRGLGLSHLITTGNEVATTTGDYIAALATDPGVDVIGVFIEGLRHPDRFAAAVAAARAQGKPVVALTVGRSELGQRAALAHTGAITGGTAAMTGYLRRIGVVSTGDIDEFREALLLFSAGITPDNSGVAIATISGGGAGLLSDVAEREHLEIAALQDETFARVQELLPEFGTVGNPLDVTGAAVERPELLAGTLAALRSDPGTGAVVLALNTACGGEGQQDLYRTQAKALVRCCAAPGSPGIAVSLANGPVDPELAGILRAAGVPLLMGVSPSLAAISRWMSWHHEPVPPRFERPAPTPRATVARGGMLTGHDALELISSAGIPVPHAYVAPDVASVSQGWQQVTAPVVLKIESPGLAHKTDIAGVEMGISSPEDLAAAAHRMVCAVTARDPRLPVAGFLVQSQVAGPSVECLVGVVRDRQVGLVLSIGPGGILAEFNSDMPTTPVPASASDVEYLIRNSPLDKLLGGFRGEPRADRAAFVRLVTRFSDLAGKLGPELQAAELNPVLVLPEGSGAVAVDALLITDGTAGIRMATMASHGLDRRDERVGRVSTTEVNT